MHMMKTLALILAMMLMVIPALAESEASPTADSSPAVDSNAAADSQKLDAAYTLALSAINAEDYETAKSYLDICFAYCDSASNPQMYADLLLKRACINVIEEKGDMAMLSLDAALKLQPELSDAYLVRAQVYASQGQTEAAIADLEKYIETSGDEAMYETVAQLYEAAGDSGNAQAAYDKYVAAAGDDAAEAGFQAGLYRMQNQQFEEAIAAFEAYGEDETYAAGAWYNIGVCRMNLDDYVVAADAFTTSVEKGGTYEGVYYNRGVCRLVQEDWENAAEDFRQSIESEPYVDDARHNLGICLMQLKQYEEAVDVFNTLIDGEGTEDASEDGEAAEPHTASVSAYYYRALCRAASGDLEGAVADYTVCIENEYELGDVYYQRAQVYAMMGDEENQKSDLQNSLKYAG